MASQIIADDRIVQLNDKDAAKGDFVVYWMQASQRVQHNHALEFAIQRANDLQSRLLVAFVITDDFPDANLRHFRFMLEGLQQTEKTLRRRNIRFAIQIGKIPDNICKLAKDAREVVCDRGYLRHQVDWRKEVAKESDCRVWQIESDVIVPVEVASEKREYAARTIRKQINEAADRFLEDLDTTPLDKDSTRLSVDTLDLSDLDSVLDSLSIDRSVEPVEEFRGGTSHAKAQLHDFISNRLSRYEERGAILESNTSYLSPYLHFGQISPIEIALAIKSSRGHQKSAKESYIEELLVRRELAFNFVHYEKNYDSLNSLPEWAATTLEEHESDKREYVYTSTELEAAQTHDPAWNAAMIEMKQRGYLHNHLRMYWGKKILEWTNTTGHAYRTTLDLNNKYFLDGRDPNSYSNVLWLFGLHDRAHQEREIFGKVRYMSYDGLKRKFDVEQYIQHIGDQYDVQIEAT